MLAYTICAILDIVHMVLRYKYYLDYDIYNSTEQYIAASNDIVYYLANFTFFVLLFLRIQTSFQLSRCNICYLLLLLTISTIGSIVYCFIMFYKIADSTADMYSYTARITYSLSISDFILNLSFFVLFIHKIQNKDSTEGMEIADDMESVHSQNSEQKAIWNLMIKHCVLFGIAMISNQLFYISMIIIQSEDHNSSISYAFPKWYTTRSFDNMINVVIFWLVLKVNNAKYLHLCKCWHLCILKYCLKEDPNIIREGFVVNEHQERLLSVDGLSLQKVIVNQDDECDKVEGFDLMVTNDSNKGTAMKSATGKSVEGHNLLMTAT